jgi:hypothetical protein
VHRKFTIHLTRFDVTVPTYFNVLHGKETLQSEVVAVFGLTPAMIGKLRKMLRKIVNSGPPGRHYHVLLSSTRVVPNEITPVLSVGEDPIIKAYVAQYKSRCGLKPEVAEAGLVASSFVRVEFMESQHRRLILGALQDFAQGEMCDWCGNSAEGLLRCSQCNAMYYCSQPCQRSHWKQSHKKGCQGSRPEPSVEFRPVEDPEERARQMQQSRDAGALVLDMDDPEAMMRMLIDMRKKRQSAAKK